MPILITTVRALLLATTAAGCARPTSAESAGAAPVPTSADLAKGEAVPLDRLSQGDPILAARALAAVEAVRPVFRPCGDLVRRGGAPTRGAVSAPTVVEWGDGALAISVGPTGLDADIDRCFADALAIARVELERSWPLGAPPVSFHLCVASGPAAIETAEGEGT
jgi:hypothetical protein